MELMIASNKNKAVTYILSYSFINLCLDLD